MECLAGICQGARHTQRRVHLERLSIQSGPSFRARVRCSAEMPRRFFGWQRRPTTGEVNDWPAHSDKVQDHAGHCHGPKPFRLGWHPTRRWTGRRAAEVAVSTREHVLTLPSTVVQTEVQWIAYAMTTTTGIQFHPDPWINRKRVESERFGQRLEAIC